MDAILKKQLLPCALGSAEPDFVLKNATVADVFSETLFPADIAVKNGVIVGVGSYSAEKETDLGGKVVVPGFIDAHMHLESSMASPAILAPKLLARGTAAVVADPHEIANVCGLEGVRYLIRDSAKTSLDVYFALPSCVPLGPYDHNGAVFGVEEMKKLRSDPHVCGLGEVMDFAAAARGDDELLRKIELMEAGTVDGHSPGMAGRALQAYRLAGVQTDHECASWPEALERLRAGFIVQIREGSAAKNLQAIVSGILRDGVACDRFVFCTDDVHLDDVEKNGHIDRNIRMAVALGMEPVRAVKIATLNAARAYGFRDRGAVAPGFRADLVVLDDLASIRIGRVYKGGIPLEDLPKNPARTRAGTKLTHSVNLLRLEADAFALRASKSFPVIGIVPGQLATEKLMLPLPEEGGFFRPADDILKIAVVQRHDGTGRTGVGAVKGFGLRNGAVASTVGHDSHNLIVVGDSDGDMLAAVEELRRCGGGYTVVSKGRILKTVRLNIAGLFTDCAEPDVSREIEEMASVARRLGVPENIDVFQNLSFLSLPVIPALRITDSGVFDVYRGRFL